MGDDEEQPVNNDEHENETAASVSDYPCAVCGKNFSRKFNRDRHFILWHNNIVRMYSCNFCGAAFDDSKKLQQHRESHKPSTGFEVWDSAFRKKCVIYRKLHSGIMSTLENAYAEDKEDMAKLISYEVEARKSMKLSIIYHVEFAKLRPQMGGAADDEVQVPEENGEVFEVADDNVNREDGGEESVNEGGADEGENGNAAEDLFEVCLRAPSSMVTMGVNVRHMMQAAHGIIQSRIDDFLQNGSGWRLHRVFCADLEIGSCPPLNGSCNLVSINYLKDFRSVKPAKDLQRCFLHACAFHFVRSNNVKRLEKFITEQFVVTIPSPVAVKNIAKFERDNSHLNLKINVIYSEDDDLYPLLVSKRTNAEHEIVLLLYQTKVSEKIVNHYAYMSNANSMLRLRYGEAGHYSYNKTIRCLNCFSQFQASKGGEEKLKRHKKNCSKNEPQTTKVPEKGEVINFRNHVNKFQSHFIGIFDFESCHVKEKYECSKCEKISESDATECHHKTLVKAIQIPITCSYLILDVYGKVVFKNTFTGRNCARRFLLELLEIEPQLLETLNQYEKLNMSKQDERQFKKSTHCHICDALLLEDSVRDHDHISGKFLGAAHSFCNLQRSVRKTIPMFAHNLTGYDSHFLIQEIGNIPEVKLFNALPYNQERFRTLEINSFRLKDSLSFLNASLNELMNNLLKNKRHKFPIMDQLGLYGENEVEKKSLILQKGIYPYEFVTSIRKLRRTLKIPAKKHFYSALTNSNVSDADYLHSKKVFKAFKCQNLLDYTELYCTTDVGILAEVVTQFRKTILHNFNLDPCHYISTPQMAYDAMLKLTKVQIQLMHDVDMILLVEQNVRGGVSYINTRHCEKKTTLEKKTEMLFIDANNLYGLAQSLPQPVGGFRWLDREEIEQLDILQMNDEQLEGYILEVDLIYPTHLHESHNSFPMAPEKLTITEEMLSPYARGKKK